MKSDRKTKNELIAELESVRRKLKKLEMLLKKSKHSERDITKRKLAEEALRESAMNLAESQRIGKLGCWDWDIAENSLSWSDEIYRIWGVGKDFLLNFDNIAGLIHPDDSEWNSKRVQEFLAFRDKGEFEFRIICPDGTVKYIYQSIEVTRAPSGQPIRMFGIMQDITERKQVEEALRESEELHRITMEHILDPVFITNDDGAFTFICANVQQILGYSSQDLHKMENVSQLLDNHLFDLNELKKLGQLLNIEREIADKQGKKRMYLISIRRVSIKGGTILYICHDITERKQAEETLRESEARYRGLFENSIMGVSQALPDGRLMCANFAYARMYGYKNPEEMMTHVPDIGQLYANPEDRKEVLRILKEKGVMEPREIAVKRRDGTRFFVLVSAREIKDSKGNLSCFQAEHVDITTHKLAEDELRKSHEELRLLANYLQNIREEERNHLAREFHDQLGQSMTALKMDLSLLLRMISDEKQEVQRKLIAEELRSMQKLVDETSNLIWIIITELRPQMLEDLGLITTFEWEAKQFELRTGISCEFKSSVGDVQLDPKMSIALFRIYQEAITNVARHANATVVKSILRIENEMLVLEIKDNGCGISIDKKSNSESFGLIGMRERALALGGLLEISGITGEGTSIIVRLPLEQVDEQESTSK